MDSKMRLVSRWSLYPTYSVVNKIARQGVRSNNRTRRSRLLEPCFLRIPCGSALAKDGFDWPAKIGSPQPGQEFAREHWCFITDSLPSGPYAIPHGLDVTRRSNHEN